MTTNNDITADPMAGGKKKTAKEQLNEISEKARIKANEIRANVEQRYQQGREQVTKAGKATDTYVRENPWAVVGAAAGVGFLLGLLIGRR